MDLDMECIQNLDRFYNNELVLANTSNPGRNPWICNAILGGPAGHTFWDIVIEGMRLVNQNINDSRDSIRHHRDNIH